MFLGLLFLLLWFVYISAPKQTEEEGVEITFADIEEEEEIEELTEPAESAYGEETAEPSSAEPAPPVEVTTRLEPASPPQHIVSEEETLALERARKEQEEKEAAERARKEKEAQAIAKANAMGSLFGNSANNNGAGNGQGDGQKGNPVSGKGSLGGSNWTLSNREAKSIPKPANSFNQEGSVVVHIRVNSEGKVTNVIDNLEGTISDKETRKLAIAAAYKAEFSELKGAQDQIGTITYNFIYTKN